MARYLGPKCKLSRRAGTDLLLKSGSRSIDTKCKIDQRPGQHAQKRTRLSGYAEQLAMQQAIKWYYGVLQRQFKNCYEKADRQKGSTGENLLRILESRLDNVVYRLGFASTRAEARQLVSHKSITVNDVIVNIPSYLLKPNDIIAICDKSKKQLRIGSAIEMAQQRPSSPWLELDPNALTGKFKSYPDLSDFPAMFKVSLVIELFSK